MMTFQAPRVSLSLCPRRLLTVALWVVAIAGGVHPAWAATKASGSALGASDAVFTRAGWDGHTVGSIDTQVFDLALGAASCAVRAGAAVRPTTLTVIDYSKPSSQPRLWVFDLAAHELLYQELVAHGQGSGANLATDFSNDADSHQSSLGLFVTEDTYVGKNGYSLRLNGLDKGFNDRARERAIVMHGASYVDASFVSAQGRLGRSWGCPAIRPAIARTLIDTVKGGSLVFAYYPNQKWLSSSAYLGNCAAAAH
jgi:L,D-transpeptidase-like protein